jgi:hypothetical protein
MAFSQFPAPAGGAAADAFAATIPDLQTTYEHIQEFAAGIYSIAIAPTSTNGQIVFADNTSILATVTTTLGVVSLQISTPATKVFITTLAGGTEDAIVTITKTADILTPDDIGNGTLDTINTTGAYNTTGLLSVLAFGGGAAGEKGAAGNSAGGAGGRAGGVGLGFVYNNGATTITIGAKGVAAVSNNTNITAPTESSFGNLLTSSANSFFWAGAGGTAVTGGNNTFGNVGLASRSFPSFNTTSTTGGGGAGPTLTGNSGNFPIGSSAGGGSGIGTGGTSAVGDGGTFTNGNPNVAGTAGTGKASGGGGGCAVGNSFLNATGRFGGDGADGVVYILRGF